MFDFLKGFDIIFVTGCQRSGTTIAAKMISYDLGYYFVMEEVFGVHDFQRCLSYLKPNHCIQAPALSAYCHLLPNEVAVVFMLRNFEDIRRSMLRVNWLDERLELSKYFRACGRIEEVKYDVWNMYQKSLIGNAFELRYESLRGHKFWIEDRKGFTSRQISFEG